jgi:hypothetical protein
MPELIEIFYMFGIFFLICLAPLSILKSKTNNLYLNLVINLNFLLIFSLLPFSISKYTIYIIIILLFFSIKNYYLSKVSIKKIVFDKYRLILFVLTYIIISVQVASQLELGWDAKWFWYIKSLFYTQNKTFSELSNYTFNDFHPHLGSFLWAFFRNFSINGYEYIGRLFYVFLYLVGIHFISKNVFKDKIKDSVLFIFLIILTHKYIYFSGLQEVLIFTTLIFISKFIFIFIEKKQFIYLFIIALCMNLLIWFKAEGIAYATICFLVVNLISKLNLQFRIYFNLLCLFFISFKTIIYKFFQIKINNQPYHLEYLLNLDLERLIYKLYNILIYLSYNSLKNIILFIVPIIIIMNYKKIIINEYLRLVSVFFILNVMFIFSAYIFREMEVVYALKTTIDRIVYSSSGFYLVFIINQTKKYL